MIGTRIHIRCFGLLPEAALFDKEGEGEGE
jgi:hypothetical protein